MVSHKYLWSCLIIYRETFGHSVTSIFNYVVF